MLFCEDDSRNTQPLSQLNTSLPRINTDKSKPRSHFLSMFIREIRGKKSSFPAWRFVVEMHYLIFE